MQKAKLALSLMALAAMAPPGLAMRNEAEGDAKTVAKKAETAATTVNFMDDVGSGMEGMDKDSIAVPFLRVLQSNSPQVNEANGEYIKDAKPGMFLNTATRQVFDGKEGVIILPCAFQRRFIQWAPRGDAQGYKGEMTNEEVEALKAEGLAVRNEEDGRLYRLEKKDETPHEKRTDKLADTRSHFVLLVDEDGNYGQALLSLSSTQIKKSKQLMAMLQSAKIQGPNGKVTPPTWLNRIKVTTVHESNDDGDWYGVQFTADGFINDQAMYDAGREFNNAIKAGDAHADHSKDEAAAGDASGGKSGKF